MSAPAATAVRTATGFALRAPWYVREKGLRDATALRPHIQMYEGNDFVERIVEDPTTYLTWGDEDWWGYPIPVTPDPDSVGRLRLATYKIHRTDMRKLYQPSHDRFYAVVVEVFCDQPGLPRAGMHDDLEVGFVMRRHQVSYSADRKSVRKLATKLVKEMAKNGSSTVDDDRIDSDVHQVRWSSEAMKNFTCENADLIDKVGPRDDRQAWVTTQRPGRWVECSGTELSTDEEQFPMWRLPPRERDCPAAGSRSLWFGVIPTFSSDHGLEGPKDKPMLVPKIDDHGHDVLNARDASPLAEPVRREMSLQLGFDFSNVRIHTSPSADESARAVNARAYTVGQDVVFQRSMYEPWSERGRSVLAHELTHVVQQSRGTVAGTDAGQGLKISDPSDRFEREADAVANQSMGSRRGAVNQQGSAVQLQRQHKRTSLAPKTWTAGIAAQVAQQVGLGRFIEPGQIMPVGVYGPPQPGGAFWLINGLNPTDLAGVLRDCGPLIRGVLLSHVGDTVGHYDTARLAAALRAESWGEHDAAISGVGLLDTIRGAEAGMASGSFATVWARLAGKPRPQIIATLRVLPRDVLVTLQGRLGEAPVSDFVLLSEVITDLLGTGTDMSPQDVIDVTALRGLDREMARIYNFRGQMLFELATALSINTAAAAGIMKVESGGATFSEATNLSIVRFENHKLWEFWGKGNQRAFNAHFDFDRVNKRTRGHLFRESIPGAWIAFHGNQVDERRVLRFAVSLAGDVAYECASFGAGQIMGFNHASVGFASAREMVEHYDRSERSQITGIFDFIRSTRLASAIRRRDFATVAQTYNGKGGVATYAPRIRAAASAYARVTTGKLHVIP